jgi:hypothetical protein
MAAAVTPECVPDRATPPLLDVQVARWLVIALPLFAPSAKVTTSEPVVVAVEADTARTPAGAAGDPTITGRDGTDAGPVPTAFVAVTVKV